MADPSVMTDKVTRLTSYEALAFSPMKATLMHASDKGYHFPPRSPMYNYHSPGHQYTFPRPFRSPVCYYYPRPHKTQLQMDLRSPVYDYPITS